MSLMVVVEGDTDIPVVEKLAADAGLSVTQVLDMGGKSQLDAHIQGYNQAAQGSPWLVLRDMDHDAACAPELVRSLCPVASPWMAMRIAVREVESWLLADVQAMAGFLGLSEALFPLNPDAEGDPTVTLVNLARRSPRAAIRKRLVPKPGASAQVGPLYEATLIEFGAKHWSLERASRRSNSLKRARRALRELGRRWRAQIGDSG